MNRRTGRSKGALDAGLRKKLDALEAELGRMGKALVAYSGGVDSTLLLKVASDVLGPKVLPVVAGSETYPTREVEAALGTARKLGLRPRFIHTGELRNPRFAANPPDRCYFCKKELFGRLKALARKAKIPFVLDGSNSDDRLDFRPGGRAAAELGIRSPLKDVGLTKDEIRSLSRHFRLPTWDKPSMACLASRFPYGSRIERKSLGQVGRAEDVLRGLGFRQFRVRHHGPVARIEVEPSDLARAIKASNREKIVRGLKRLGYVYVALDLEGYRTGSLNEALPEGRPVHRKKSSGGPGRPGSAGLSVRRRRP
jgi:uncharacterized protein